MLKNDKINLIIALLVAIGLWAYVVGMENPEKDTSINDVPITFLNEETLSSEGLTLLSVSDTVVDVKITGIQSALRSVKKSDIKITVDLEGYQEGEHTVQLQIGKIDNVTIESKQKISVVIDKLITADKPVEVTLSGTVSDDAEPYIVQVSPQSVEVTGAKSLVDSIVKLEAPLDSESVETELKSFTVTLLPVDREGQLVEGVSLSKSSTSISAVTLNKRTVRLNVPVIGQNLEGAERIVDVPKTITVKGMDADLRSITSISTEAIDVSEIYSDKMIPLTPILPEGVELASNSQDLKAKVEVNGMEIRSFEYSKDAVVVEGITEEEIVTVEDVTIKLEATGMESMMENMDSGAFEFYVDVKGLAPGTHRVKLQCRHSVSLNRLEFTPGEITVVIEEPEMPENGNGENDASADGEDTDNTQHTPQEDGAESGI